MVRVYGWLDQSRVNGPGLRSVVWLKGCTLGCAGCWAPDTHSHAGGSLKHYVEICDWLYLEQKLLGTIGVTFSGGEPLEQARSLVQIMVRMRRFLPDFSFGLYSGYTEHELEEGRFYHVASNGEEDSQMTKTWLWRQLKKHLDFAVLGRYNERQPVVDQLRSSRNQRLVLLSDRYQKDDFGPQSVEAHISDDGGFVRITGFPR